MISKEFLTEFSNKFIKIADDLSNCIKIPTEDWGWENHRYQSDIFRLLHIERYFVDSMWVLHIVCFPHKNNINPMYGFDVICSAPKQQILSLFLDYSPVIQDEKFHNETFKHPRELPEWANMFSKHFVAIRPEPDEYGKAFDLAFDLFETFIKRLNDPKYITQDADMIKQVIANQNRYCSHQQQNQRTFNSLAAKIGDENARYFIDNILFPKIIE